MTNNKTKKNTKNTNSKLTSTNTTKNYKQTNKQIRNKKQKI